MSIKSVVVFYSVLSGIRLGCLFMAKIQKELTSTTIEYILHALRRN